MINYIRKIRYLMKTVSFLLTNRGKEGYGKKRKREKEIENDLYTENRIFKESPKYFRNIKNYREMNN